MQSTGNTTPDQSQVIKDLQQKLDNLTNNKSMGIIGQTIKDITTSQPDALGKYDPKELFGLEESAVGLSNIMSLTSDVKLLTGQILEYYREEAVIQNNITSKMGVTSDYAESIKSTIQDTLPAALKLGYGVDQLVGLYTNLSDQTGRFAIVSESILKDSLDTSRAFVGDLTDMGKTFGEFEKVGIGYRDTLDDINEIGTKSLSLGLNSKKTVSDVRENLDKLNQYGFKNGIQGLAEMSRVAKMFRMDMQSAFTVADKVMDPANAIEMSANLQVLGGAIGDFANPLKLMYDATNDVGGIQKSIVEAAKSLAVYNQEQGKFEITGANMRRAREMAQLTGVDYKELERGAIAANEKISGLQQLMSTGFKGSKDDKDFLLNLAHMEHGKMMITIPENMKEQFGEFGKKGQIAFEDLSEKYASQILSNKKFFEKMTPAEIAEGQLTELQMMNRNIGSIAAYYRNRAGQTTKAGGENSGFTKEIHLAVNKLSSVATNLSKNSDSASKFTEDQKKNINEAIKSVLGDTSGTLTKIGDQINKSLGLTDENFTKNTQLNRFTDTEERRAQEISQKIYESNQSTQNNVTTTNETQKVDIQVTHSFNPTDSVSNSIYRETIKNHGIRQQLQSTPDKRDFDYFQYAKRGGKKG